MKTLDELHLRLDAWLIAYAGATRADIDVGTVRDARDALRELIADAERAEVYRHERDHTRARLDIAVKHLAEIHMRLYPEPFVHKETGTEYRFNPPNPHLYLQELSDQIRSIPDTLEASRKG